MFHAIITRVSLRRPDTLNPDRGGLSAKLYDQICRASLKQQTNQNFTAISAWGLTCDGNPLANEHQIIAPPIPDQFHNAGELFANHILSITREEELLVTRVDSDDALKNDFVKELQQLVTEYAAVKLPYYFDVASFWQVNHKSKLVRLKMFKENYISPFVSVRCTRGDAVRVLKRIMTKHAATSEVTTGGIRSKRLNVLETIHDKNVRNRPCGELTKLSVSINDFIGKDVVYVK